MPRLVIQLALGAVALLILIVAGMWVIGLGPFNTRPSPAAKVAVQTQKAVTKTQGEAKAATDQAETATRKTIATTEKRTEGHVAKIRAAAPRAIPADVPDGEFFAGVCESKLYAGSADCRGLGGQLEGGGSRPGPRAVRGR